MKTKIRNLQPLCTVMSCEYRQKHPTDIQRIEELEDEIDSIREWARDIKISLELEDIKHGTVKEVIKNNLTFKKNEIKFKIENSNLLNKCDNQEETIQKQSIELKQLKQEKDEVITEMQANQKLNSLLEEIKKLEDKKDNLTKVINQKQKLKSKIEDDIRTFIKDFKQLIHKHNEKLTEHKLLLHTIKKTKRRKWLSIFMKDF